MIWYQWIMAALVLFIVEMLTPGVFFFACLALGALVAGISTFVAVPAVVPWIVFVVVSIGSMYIVRPIAQKYFAHPMKKTGVDALVGQEVLVTEAINPPQLGAIKAQGEVWRAQSVQPIAVGVAVTIMDVQGNHVVVKTK